MKSSFLKPKSGSSNGVASTATARHPVMRAKKLKFFFEKPPATKGPQVIPDEEFETETEKPANPAVAATPSPRRLAPPATFAEMHIKAGDKIPIETAEYSSSGGVKGKRMVGRVIGWMEGNSLLVSVPENAAHAGLVRENEQVLLRAFTGQNAFAFHSTIIKIATAPYTYMHLTFPSQVQAVRIRSSVRHAVYLPLMVSAAAEEEAETKAAEVGHMLNIGVNGACIGTIKPFKDKSPIQIALQFELYDTQVSLELHALIRSSKEISGEQTATRYEYGVEFQDLQPGDRLALGSLLWYEMHTHPERVV